MSEGQVREAFREQAGWCRKLGSPFTAMVCDALAARLEPGARFAQRILGWQGHPQRDALALRAAGALHSLARSGLAPALAAVYPPHHADADAWWEAARDAIAAHDLRLHDFVDSPPQTNEVSRSAVLLGAFLTIAAEMRCPLNLLEIGASAGLNLAFDQYRYDLGVGRWGDEASPVAIQCEWSGEAPRLDASLDVVARAACDRNPLDPASTNDRDRLLAYIWADQGQRLARMSAALDLARRRTWSVDRADAADWLESRRSALPQDAVTVIFHTIVWQYLAEATRDRIKGILNAAAERARPASPLAWLRMEAEGDSAGLRLTTWPGGEEKLLGHADFHGRWVRWL